MANAGQGTPPAERLTVGEKLLYGVGQGAPSTGENVISFYLLFYYTKIVQLSPTLIGAAMLIGRLWDAVTDPMMGYITDETRARLGRRRVYIIFGAVPFGIAIFLLWNPFTAISGNIAFPYLLVTFLAYSTTLTICHVPYVTLGGELSSDVHERSSIIGFRQIFWVIGILIGAGATPILVSTIAGAPSKEVVSRPGWIVAGAIYGGVAALLFLIAGLRTRERVVPAPHVASTRGGRAAVTGALRVTAMTLRNRNFRIIAAVFLITQVGFVMTTATLPFLIADWMQLPDAMMTIIMVCLLLATVPFMGVWVHASRRIGKKRAYVLGLTILGLLPFQSFWMVNPAYWTGWIYIYAIIFGVGFATHMVFPWAIIPDILDIEELETGERRDGSYFGAMTFLGKSASALSVALAGSLIDLVGYDKTAAVQTASALFGLRCIYAILPGIAFLGSMLMLTRLSVTEETAAEVRRRLHERHAEGEPDPEPEPA